ncbi:MAG: TolC family protein [Caulobacteraceae bacterium]
MSPWPTSSRPTPRSPASARPCSPPSTPRPRSSISSRRAPGAARSTPVTIRPASASSSWELDLFGRTRSLTRAAYDQYLAAEDNRRAVQVSLIAEVATAWFTYAADQDLLAVARQTLAAQEAQLSLTTARASGGGRPPIWTCAGPDRRRTGPLRHRQLHHRRGPGPNAPRTCWSGVRVDPRACPRPWR